MWSQVLQQIRRLAYDDGAWNSFGWVEENTFMQPMSMVGQLSRDADLNPEAVIVRYFNGSIPEVKLGESLSLYLIEHYDKVREIMEVLFRLADTRVKVECDTRDELDIVLQDLDYYMDAGFIGEDDLVLAWHISNKFGVNAGRDADKRKAFKLQEKADTKAGRDQHGDEHSEFDPDDGDPPYWMLQYRKLDKVGNIAVGSQQFEEGTRFHALGLETDKCKRGWAFAQGVLSRMLNKLMHQLYEREPEMVSSSGSWFRIPMLDGMPVTEMTKPTYRGLIKVSKVIERPGRDPGLFIDLPIHVLGALWRMHGPDEVAQAWDIVRLMSREQVLEFVHSLSKYAKTFKATCILLWDMNYGRVRGKAIHVPVGHKAVVVQTIKIAAFGGSFAMLKMPKVYKDGPKQAPVNAANAKQVPSRNQG